MEEEDLELHFVVWHLELSDLVGVVELELVEGEGVVELQLACRS